MSRVCQITGKRTHTGRSISRRGKPKKEGGIGLKTTGITNRKFRPNTQTKRFWVPELGRFVRVKLCKKALKTIDRDGAYSVLREAGLVSPVSHKKKSKENKGKK
jgi:large subunit ribosomal protein L28